MSETGLPDLSGRVVLITGASSGLGRVFARRAARSGAAVAACARRRERLDELVAEIEADGGRAMAITMDVTDDASVAAGFADAEAQLGPIFSVVANAGISDTALPMKMTSDEFRAVIDVNLTGVFATIREAATRMIANGSAERENGRIVILASLAAETVIGKMVAYNSSKAGVKMLGRAFAKEVIHKGINVNTVSPGYLLTEINEGFFTSEIGQKKIESFPRKRMIEATDLAPMVLFLLSDAAKAMTGRDFVVDDGQFL